MKMNLTGKVDKNRDDISTHIIMHTLTDTIIKELKGSPQKHGIIADVRLTINKYEVNFESFCKHWESQVERMIKEKATELMQEKFSNINDLLYDLEERLKGEINKRLED